MQGVSPRLANLVGLVVLAAAMSRVAAAQRQIGMVTSVRQVSPRSGCLPSYGATAATVVLRERPPSIAQPVEPPFPKDLALGDRFELQKRTDARLRIADPVFGRGVIVLAPQILCEAWAADSAFGRSSVATGKYVLDTISVRPRGVQLRLTIERGGAFVQWDSTLKYRLRVNDIELTGTEIVVAVDSGSGRSLLYVRRGTVSFPEFPGVEAVAGDVYRLMPGTLPQLIARPSADAPAYGEDVEYHATLIWEGAEQSSVIHRALTNPLTYVGVAGIGYGIYRLVPRPRRTHTATVVVQVPL